RRRDPARGYQIGQPADAGEALPPVETQRGAVAGVARHEQPPPAREHPRLDVGHEPAAQPLPARVRPDREQRDEPAEQETVRRDDDPVGGPPARPRDEDVARAREPRQIPSERGRPIVEPLPRLDPGDPVRLLARHGRRGPDDRRPGHCGPGSEIAAGASVDAGETGIGAGAARPAAISSERSTKWKPRARSSRVITGSGSAVFRPRPLMWKMMIDPARALSTTLWTMRSTVVCALGSPETTSQVTVGRCRSCTTVTRWWLHSPNGGRKATLRLPYFASATSVWSICSTMRASGRWAMCGWS